MVCLARAVTEDTAPCRDMIFSILAITTFIIIKNKEPAKEIRELEKGRNVIFSRKEKEEQFEESYRSLMRHRKHSKRSSTITSATVQK